MMLCWILNLLDFPFCFPASLNLLNLLTCHLCYLFHDRGHHTGKAELRTNCPKLSVFALLRQRENRNKIMVTWRVVWTEVMEATQFRVQGVPCVYFAAWQSGRIMWTYKSWSLALHCMRFACILRVFKKNAAEIVHCLSGFIWHTQFSSWNCVIMSRLSELSVFNKEDKMCRPVGLQDQSWELLV